MTPRRALAATPSRRRTVRTALVAGVAALLLTAPTTAPASASAGAAGPAPVAGATAPPVDGQPALAEEAARTVTVLTDDGEGGLEVRVVETADAAAARGLVAREQRDPDVVVASVAVPVRAAATDPYRISQWPLRDLRADAAWPRSTGAGQVVAVLDSGVDASHPDLRGVVLRGRSTTGNGRDGRVDKYGHGTHVAGIIAAVPDNGIGTAGLAPGAKVLPVQVLDDRGQGTSAAVTAGILWAADNGATVINMSLGGPTPDPAMEAAIDNARSRGVVVVASSGNESATRVAYPAAYPGVLAVGATTRTRAVVGFSNRGSALDVVAPGVEVLSTVPGGAYEAWDGTSMAAPYASAAAALLRAAQPQLDEAQVRGRLESTAVDLGAVGRDDVSGHGLVDPVTALGGSPAPAPDMTAPGMVTPGTTTVGTGSVRLRWSPPSDADYAGVVVVPVPRLQYVTYPGEGTPVYSGTRTDVGVTGLDARTGHTFAVFARDRAGNLSRPRHVHVDGLRLSVVTTSTADTTRAVTTLRHGGSVVVRATALDPDGIGAHGVPLTFQARPPGSSTWSTIGRVTTSGSQARLVHAPTRTVEYRVLYPGAAGAPGRLGVATAPRRLTVHMTVSATTSATTVRRGTAVTVSGAVSPNHAGKVVRLERRTATGWSKVAERTLSSTSTYRFSVSRSTSGSTTYRVVAPADADHGTGTSPSRTISWT